MRIMEPVQIVDLVILMELGREWVEPGSKFTNPLFSQLQQTEIQRDVYYRR